MKNSKFDESVPESHDHDNWHDIDLGLNAQGRTVGIDLRNDPHTLIVGGRGGEISIALQRVFVSAISRGHQVVLLTSSNGEQDFRRHRGWLTASATTEREVAEALRLLHVELGRRKVILAHWGASFWMNLSAETRRFEKLFPIAVLVDDYVMHFRQAATPRWAETILPAEFSRLQALNKAKAASQVIIEQLAREGGRFGIHLVASVNTPDLNALPGGLQRNLTARVLVINPHAFSVPSNIRQLFPNAGQEASCMLKEAARELVRSKGHALVLGAQKQLSLARIDLVRSNEVSEYLKAIGVPRPDTWHLDR